MPLTKAELNEWCDFLEANPQLQGTGTLMSHDGKMCCLAALAVLQNVPRTLNTTESCYQFEFLGESCAISTGSLKGYLAERLGSPLGRFGPMGMPSIYYKGYNYHSAAAANDNHVPWPVIAGHFRKHYKTAD